MYQLLLPCIKRKRIIQLRVNAGGGEGVDGQTGNKTDNKRERGGWQTGETHIISERGQTGETKIDSEGGGAGRRDSDYNKGGTQGKISSLVPRPKNLRLGSVEFRVRYHPKSRDQKGGIPPFLKLFEMFQTCCRQHSDSIVDGRYGIIMSVLSAVDPGVFMPAIVILSQCMRCA